MYERLIIFVFGLSFLTACPSDHCGTRGVLRCAANVVQVCDTHGNWRDTTNCSTVEPGNWSCDQIDEQLTTCVQTVDEEE